MSLLDVFFNFCQPYSFGRSLTESGVTNLVIVVGQQVSGIHLFLPPQFWDDCVCIWLLFECLGSNSGHHGFVVSMY